MNYEKEFKELNEKSNQKSTLLTLIPHGMKCDNPSCDWMDMSIDFKDYAVYVNKPCPKCGENLFTEKCAKRTIKNVKRVIFIGNLLSKVMSPEERTIAENSERTVIKAYDVDKDGKLIV